MMASFVTCPSCNALLLSDTLQCPECQYVLSTESNPGPEDAAQDAPQSPERVEANQQAPADPPPASAESPSSPETDPQNGSEQTELPQTSPEDPCPNCGEMVRRGLVRCWNCNTFMRKDIEEQYHRMRESAKPVIFSELPDGTSAREQLEELTRQPQQALPQAEDDDFQLAPGVAPMAAEDDDFELRTSAPVAGQSENEQGGFEIPLLDEQADDSGSDESGEEAASGTRETAEQTPAAKKGGSETPATEDHSTATAGDALLQTALEEEKELQQRQRRDKSGRRRAGKPASGDVLVVYCPNGCRIKVRERHRGKSGRCPRCGAEFTVPRRKAAAKKKPKKEERHQETAPAADAPSGSAAEGPYEWIRDVRLHLFEPKKLKLKPGVLENSFQPVDIGMDSEGMLVAALVKKVGLLKVAEGKKDAVREAMLAHLREGKSLDELPVPRHDYYEAEAVQELRVVQPVRYEHESMFAGVPVFGEGRIAVRLPGGESDAERRFLSFTLSGFREFARLLEKLYGIRDFGDENDVPLTDQYTDLRCHYTDEGIRALEYTGFYEADPAFKLKLVGRRCQHCGAAVSEDARRKEKLGGLHGKSIARAKCPECGGKFGKLSLYALDEAPAENE